MAKKTPALSPKAQEILDFLKTQETDLTLAEIKETIPTANSAHLTALRTRNLVVGDEVEREVIKTTKSKVLAYSVIRDDLVADADADADADNENA